MTRRVTIDLGMALTRDGIWIIDAAGLTTYANARMAEILATTVDEMLGEPSFNFVFPADVPDAQRLFESKERGDARPFVFNLRRKDGSAVRTNVQGTPLRNAAGEFVGIVGTFTVS